MGVDEHTIQLAGSPVFFRSATPSRPTLFVHSLPTSSDDFVELLASCGGVAVDLPGFGRSGKAGNLDYTLDGYVDFLVRFLDAVALERVVLVGHGWGGAAGLLLARRHPGRVSALALADPLPLLPGYQWTPLARWLRRPGIGELAMGAITRRMMARGLRGASADAGSWPRERLDAVWDQFDQGTQRAILRLLRSVTAEGLAAVGEELTGLAQEVTIVWGESDPWLPASFADAYAARLPQAVVCRVPGAGHWPWLDRPEAGAELTRLARGTP